jgi:magnesium chelatase family protein
MLDRFDLRIALDRPAPDQIVSTDKGESSASVRDRVEQVRAASLERGFLNGDIPHDALDALAPLHTDAVRLLRESLETGRLTGRGYHRVRRVARTIADLRHGRHEISPDDVLAALSLRQQLGTRVKVSA